MAVFRLSPAAPDVPRLNSMRRWRRLDENAAAPLRRLEALRTMARPRPLYVYGLVGGGLRQTSRSCRSRRTQRGPAPLSPYAVSKARRRAVRELLPPRARRAGHLTAAVSRSYGPGSAQSRRSTTWSSEAGSPGGRAGSGCARPTVTRDFRVRGRRRRGRRWISLSVPPARGEVLQRGDRSGDEHGRAGRRRSSPSLASGKARVISPWTGAPRRPNALRRIHRAAQRPGR